MVMKYAMGEKEVIIQRRGREEAERKLRAVAKERDDVTARAKALAQDKAKAQQVADSRHQVIESLNKWSKSTLPLFRNSYSFHLPGVVWTLDVNFLPSFAPSVKLKRSSNCSKSCRVWHQLCDLGFVYLLLKYCFICPILIGEMEMRQNGQRAMVKTPKSKATI